MIEEKEYYKKITPFYTTIPNEIEFKEQLYRSMNVFRQLDFLVKPRLKIGNKETDDITRKDFNKEALALRMYDVN
mgnify:CR=1 FL=1